MARTAQRTHVDKVETATVASAMDDTRSTPPPDDETRHDESGRAAAKRIMSALYPEVVISASGEGFTGTAVYSPEKEHTGAPGWVQGGLSATVLDYVSARIARAALESPVATGTLDLRYRQPILIDAGPYEVVGSSDEPRSRTVRVHAAIMSAEGRPLVEAHGLFVGVTREDPPAA